jgi:hypothetical protein
MTASSLVIKAAFVSAVVLASADPAAQMRDAALKRLPAA